MNKVALRANNLSKWFGEGESRTYAVRDVSFEAFAGEILFIVGPSGSGKTTLLSMISGILKPNTGEVRIPRHRDHLFHQYDRSFQIDRDR